MADLTPELEAERVKICRIAKNVGLDFYETIFELVPYNLLNEIAARGGFPVRYPHWRFGMEYEQFSKSYEYGLSKIYELVINNDPCIAYLMEGNELLDQKLVMAHVYGHCDFFKNNMWFSQTDRKMMDTMANHSTRVRRYVDNLGIEIVEDFIDRALSIENLIDRYSPYAKNKVELHKDIDAPVQPPASNLAPGRFHVHRDYMESYINPPAALNAAQKKEDEDNKPLFPEQPEKDILKFLIKHAPLEDWQADILSIIRDESYYFAPQGMTKIMNEGWASYWHSRLMTEEIMNDSEIVDFADRHSGTMAMAPNGFNPYKIGLEIFREIEQRWNRGQHGLEWEKCDDETARLNWDTKAMRGKEKIFEVRRNYNDIGFIDEFLTEDFCVRNKMFVYKFNKRTGQFEIDTRDFKAIKAKLLFQLTNFGQPVISIVDANFNNRGEMLLAHLYEGIDLQPDYMEATLKNLQSIWQKPVSLVTVMDGEGKVFTHDGKEVKSTLFSDLPVGKENESEEKKA